MIEGCSRCGVRPDVDCRHRKGAGSPPPAVAEPPKLNKRGAGNNGFGGLAFHGDRVTKDRVRAMADALFSKPKP